MPPWSGTWPYSHGRLADRLADMGDMGATLEGRRQAIALLRRLSADHPEDRDLRLRFANALQKLGNNLGNPQFPNVGDTGGALENLDSAGAIFRELLAGDPTNATLRRFVAVNLSNVADVLRGKGDHDAALERARKSLTAFEALASADPSDAQARADVAIGHAKIGEIRAEAKDWTGAESSYRRALDIHQALSRADPSNATEREEVGLAAEPRRGCPDPLAGTSRAGCAPAGGRSHLRRPSPPPIPRTRRCACRGPAPAPRVGPGPRRSRRGVFGRSRAPDAVEPGRVVVRTRHVDARGPRATRAPSRDPTPASWIASPGCGPRRERALDAPPSPR